MHLLHCAKNSFILRPADYIVSGNPFPDNCDKRSFEWRGCSLPLHPRATISWSLHYQSFCDHSIYYRDFPLVNYI